MSNQSHNSPPIPSQEDLEKYLKLSVLGKREELFKDKEFSAWIQKHYKWLFSKDGADQMHTLRKKIKLTLDWEEAIKENKGPLA